MRLLFRFLGLGCMLLVFSVPAAQAEIVVRDDAGLVLTLKQPARRIVSLAPFTTELLFAAGAGDHVVGVVEFSNYPAAARQLPRVGSYNNLDLEGIIRLKPDLIVAWRSGTPDKQIRKLRQLGYDIYLAEPRKIEDVPETLKRLGRLAGTDRAAGKQATAFQRQYRRLRQRYIDRPEVTVFYQIWDRPLMTVNGRHLISHVIRLCSGRNVFADLDVLAPRISIESVLTKNPEVIITGGMGEARPQWLQAWRRWPQLRAVARKNLYFIHPDLLQRHSPRILLGAKKMCQFLEQARRKR